jgi:hypothetical protein
MPAMVAPVEYTITREDFIAIGGHKDTIRPLSEVIQEMEKKKPGT